MAKSPSVTLIRSLISKLHPPSGPATPRESQHLLRTLNGAFRKQLDEAHPAPSSVPYAELSDAPSGGRGSASHHFDTLLHHPLLENANTARHQVQRTSSSTTAIADFERLMREGRVTIDALRESTSKYTAARKAGQHQKQMMAPALIAWFSTADHASQVEFFHSFPTVESVLLALHLDRAGSTAWEWLGILYERSWESIQAQKQTWLLSEDFFVSKMMNMAILNRNPISAAQQFIAAMEYRKNSDRQSSGGLVAGEAPNYSWGRLASFILMRRNEHGIPNHAFDVALRYAPSTGKWSSLTPSLLSLYHPGSPKAEDLYKDLQNEAKATLLVSWKAARSAGVQRALLTSILDAADLSQTQNRRSQAAFFLKFAQTHFPDMVSKPSEGDTPVAQLAHARSEVNAVVSESRKAAIATHGTSKVYTPRLDYFHTPTFG